MRHAVTIGFRHDDESPVVITGPEVPPLDQKTAFNAVNGQRAHPHFSRIEVWHSDGGRVKRKRFFKSAPPQSEDAGKPEDDAAKSAAADPEDSAAKPAPKSVKKTAK